MYVVMKYEHSVEQTNIVVSRILFNYVPYWPAQQNICIPARTNVALVIFINVLWSMQPSFSKLRKILIMLLS